MNIAFSFACVLAMLAGAPLSSAQDLVPRSQIEDLGKSGAPPGQPLRSVTPLGISMIMEFEGWRPSAYNDPAGYCTIGYGHLIGLNKCGVADASRRLTGEQGKEVLDADSRTSRRAIEQLVKVSLTDHEFSALSSFVFNVGKDKFAKSTLLKLINSENKTAVDREFPRWVMAKGKTLDGLRDRRACEAELFSGHLAGDGKGNFRRSECASHGATPSAENLIDIDVGEK